MKTQNILKTIGALGLLFAIVVWAAPVSRVTEFSDGDVLTASDLNSEFNNLITGINSINNAQIANSAAIAPSKIAATIKGDAIARNASTGALSTKVDDTTLEIASDALRIKDDGVTTDKIIDDAVTTAKIADNSVSFAQSIFRPYTLGSSGYGNAGDIRYVDDTSICENSVFCDNTGVPAVNIGITVTGNRPMVFQGYNQAFTSASTATDEIFFFSDTATDFSAETRVRFLAKTQAAVSYTEYGRTFFKVRLRDNNEVFSWSCSDISFIWVPPAAGTYNVGIAISNNVSTYDSTFTCRYIAYEL